ncbi:hypothetical protein [Bacillus marasmi]|uniref:hypothetical protein n=1 Tax=Bacillus marasmi TaxID=1926279 RepID=UPI0011C754B4|nr:hypothetical protein [Bacillus marasmi]
MGICPNCNGLYQVMFQCPSCGVEMEDNGKIMDFYDDYSPYMEVDDLKLEDGYPNTLSKQQCPHLMSCVNCGRNEVVFIQE